MTSKLTEDAIEMMAVAELEKLGYRYFYGPDIAPDSENPQRSDFVNDYIFDGEYILLGEGGTVRKKEKRHEQ